MNANNPKKRLVCFDLGGVLINIHPSLEALCAKYQVPVLPELFAQTKVSRKTLKTAYHKGECNLRTYSKNLGEILENRYTPAQMLTLHKAEIIGAFDDTSTANLFEELTKAQYTVAILSNTCEAHWQQIITQYCFPQKTDYLFLSFEINEAKPAQTFYQIVEETTGFEPEHVIFFDDNDENVIAAQQRGWYAHQIIGGPPPLDQIQTILRRYEMLA